MSMLDFIAPMTTGLGAVGGMLGLGGSDPSAAGGQYVTPANYGTQPYQGGPWPAYGGGAGGNPQHTEFHGDFSKPGAAEDFFAQHQNQWGSPGQSNAAQWWGENKGKFGEGQADQYWNGLMGRMGGGPPTTAKNAQGAYDQFQRSVPANTDPYYDNARRTANEGIDRAYAARGMRGSSAEMDQVAEAMVGLGAQQANANAGYGLQRANTAGNLAQGADASSGRDIQNQLSWMTGMGGLGLGVQNSDLRRLIASGSLAGNIDQNALSWLNAGMGAATAAQGAEATRGQNFFNNTLQGSQAISGPELAIYLQMLGNDAALQQGAIDASTGYAREAANQSVQGRAQSEQGIGNLFGILGAAKGGGLF